MKRSVRPSGNQSFKGGLVVRWQRVRPDDLGIEQLFERVPDAVIVADVATGRIVLWNPAAVALFGYATDEIVGQPIEVLMPAACRSQHAAGMHEYRASGHGHYIDGGLPMELPALTRDGTALTIELTLSPLAHPPTGQRFVMAIARDVTARKQAQRSAAEAAARIEMVGLAGQAANLAPDAETAASEIIATVCRKGGFDVGHLYLVGAPAGRLEPSHVWWLGDAARQQVFQEATARTILAPGHGLPGRVVAQGEVVWVEDLAADAGFPRAAAAAAAGLVSGVGVPIRVGAAVVGALEFFSAERRPADPDVAAALGQVGTHLGRAYERAWAAEERERVARLLEEAQRIAGLGTWTWDLEGDRFEGSAELRRIYGFDDPGRAFTGEDFLAAVHPDDREAAREAIRTALGRRSAYLFEHRIVRADGEPRILLEEGRVATRPGATGPCLIGITRDVTEERQRERALKDAEERWRALVRSAPDLISIVDRQARLTFINRTLPGVAPEDVVGRAAFEFVLPSYREVGERVLEQVFRDGRPGSVEVQAFGAHGEPGWFHCSIGPLRVDGVVDGAILIATDITARKAAQEELQRLNATLEERIAERTAALEVVNQELEAFSYSVSHDLRAPLRAIDGFSQILLEDHAEVLPAQAQGHLRVVRAASQEMAQLIDDLLRLSRVTRSELRRAPVDLSAMVRARLAELQRRTPRPEVEAEVADGCSAYGDARLLRLLLGNLLENAWKFTARTAAPRIAFGCEARGGEVAYFVRDNGVGFDMAYADKLFRPFSRLHRVEDFDGTGIGLATVQRVVARHGGRAWAEGAVGAGATFWFTVPAEAERRDG